MNVAERTRRGTPMIDQDTVAEQVEKLLAQLPTRIIHGICPHCNASAFALGPGTPVIALCGATRHVPSAPIDYTSALTCATCDQHALVGCPRCGAQFVSSRSTT